MSLMVITMFALVYIGLAVGRLPGLPVERTGVALLGAVAMVLLGALPHGIEPVIDVPTLALLFALMVISAQLRLAGFYSAVVRRVVTLDVSPRALLGGVVATAGVLSAGLTNDVVCLAMTPVLIEGCARRRLDPIPYLLGLACASNVGSAATLIGNPQNILIGEALDLSFTGFMVDAAVPAALGLAATWAVIAWQFRHRWNKEMRVSEVAARPFLWGQALKGTLVGGAALLLFVGAPDLPRAWVALGAAGALLLSQQFARRELLSLVDWALLVLFASLFVVNGALEATGATDAALGALTAWGIDASQPAWLFGISAVLSNLVSNVPATMLLLPSATHPLAGPVLALSSTLAGNLVIVGSIANIIVVTGARASGVEISLAAHARTGVPVTLVTLAVAAGWLVFRAAAR